VSVGKYAKLMDGTSLARALLAQTAKRAEIFFRRTGRSPCLAVILVGSDTMAMRHAYRKKVRCDESGLALRMVQLPWAATSSEVMAAVVQLSDDSSVDGIFVQYPLPPHVDERAVFDATAREKDVDGATSLSIAATAIGAPGFRACTAAAIMLLLDHYGVELKGLHAVVIGTSPTLGLPTGMMMLGRCATVTYCRAESPELADIVKRADLTVSGVGRRKLVRGEWLKPESVVVDAGYYNGSVGDVNTAEAMLSARLISPVPGGVGPVTIAVLLHQTVVAAERRAPLKSAPRTDASIRPSGGLSSR
jgi:methylenetetrahydrofolate dehydrogenase (NADP+)/methenyltetrahydrofolate cyclohydrolase